MFHSLICHRVCMGQFLVNKYLRDIYVYIYIFSLSQLIRWLLYACEANSPFLVSILSPRYIKRAILFHFTLISQSPFLYLFIPPFRSAVRWFHRMSICLNVLTARIIFQHYYITEKKSIHLEKIHTYIGMCIKPCSSRRRRPPFYIQRKSGRSYRKYKALYGFNVKSTLIVSQFI